MGETHRPLPDRHAGGQVDRNRPRGRGAPGAGSARILSLRTLVAFSLPLGLVALALQTPQRTPAAAQSALAGYVAGPGASTVGGRPTRGGRGGGAAPLLSGAQPGGEPTLIAPPAPGPERPDGRERAPGAR